MFVGIISCAPITLTPFSCSSTVHPTSISFATTGFMWSIITLSTKMSPLVMAAATMYVPASILSGITVCSTASSFSTPVIFMVLVPAPLTFAPILFRKLARSTISGSSAAFSMVVVPSASTAAIMMFSVAPTEGKSRYILLPDSFCAAASIYP